MHVMTTADILLPKEKDLSAWCVIACDQFTSQKEYWERARALAGEGPSALDLMLPEAWLGTPAAEGAEERIAARMRRCLAEGVFSEVKDSFIYLERTLNSGKVRRGLMAALDLECYDFSAQSRAPVRSTEGTVEDRLPPRLRIRAAAPLEMPHVMVLMDDRDDRVLAPLERAARTMERLYDTDLMLSGGHIAGWQVRGEAASAVQTALDSLGEASLQRQKYGEAAENGPLTFAAGDGNHSLAAAKRWWEQLKPALTGEERQTHPARFALVELVNIQDEAMRFAPIHRLIRNTDDSAFPKELAAHRREWEAPGLSIGQRVAAADAFCQRYIDAHGGAVDYIHGDAAAKELGGRPGCGAVLLPPMDKNDLFLSVLHSGPLPRKSFSLGAAEDKRYYLECRRIK